MPPVNNRIIDDTVKDILPLALGVLLGLSVCLLLFAAVQADRQDYLVETTGGETRCYESAELEEGFLHVDGGAIPAHRIESITEREDCSESRQQSLNDE